ncbi:MAG: hypothetical protein DDT26_00025 [Dehalococcoidia bacterium]|nr:hypothetical protein [Chloroflexota bacterium]
MPQVTLSDVIIPDVFNSYITVNSPEKTAFGRSGVLSAGGQWDSYAANPGYITTMPFWNDLDATVEPNYGNDVYNDIAQPQDVNAGEQISRISMLNEGWAAMRFVNDLVKADPMQHIANRINAYWDRQLQRRAIACSLGVYNDNLAANGGDMVRDISSSIPGTVTALNRFNVDAFIDTAFTLGDSYDNLTAIAVHSIVARSMIKADQIEEVRDSEGNLLMMAYKGKVVIIDDGLPTFGTGVDRKYLSILWGQGAFAFGQAQTSFADGEVDREPARGNGQGADTLWSRRRWLIHPFGYKFLSAAVTGPGLSPTWADLALATNWERVLVRKNVPMAFLVSNG